MMGLHAVIGKINCESLWFSILFATFALVMEKFKEKYREFKEWQQQPYQVAPLSEEAHDCPTCGTHYEGNFCPRCGQSSKIGRYSFKKAFLLFLDVWGIGNRGMFRTLRDLLLRPGYMIRDYLQGMQMAYFPPFKMFFLLIALDFLVETGMNIRLENLYQKNQHQVEAKVNEVFFADQKTSDKAFPQNPSAKNNGKSAKETTTETQMATDAHSISKKINEWVPNHISLVLIVILLLYSWPLYMMFRKCPAYPGIKFPEFFVAMIYTYNLLAVYSIIVNFFCLNSIIEICCSVLAIIPLKQLSGYSYWRTLLKIMVALPLFLLIVFVLSLLASAFIGLYFWLTSS